MNKLIILCVFGILSLSILSWNISRASEIPPTPAFSKIVTANGTITALNYSTPLKVVAGSNVTITVNNALKTLTISAKGSGGNSSIKVNTTSCPNGVSSITNSTGVVTCMQYPPTMIVKQVSLTGKNATIPLTTLFTPSSNGTYRVSAYQVDSQSSVSGTLSTTISWMDETSTSQNATPAPNLSLTIIGGFSQGSIYIDSKSGQNISYQATLSGVSGNPKYSLYITVEKLS